MSNRSSGRRRRGGRPTSNRGPTDGNRPQAHRNSGNAHQLLDKYKNLARDAHQQGDRVLNEYYLQFSDHYFRVLAEVNERKEDQKRGRDDSQSKQRDDNQPKQQDRKDGSSRKDDASSNEPKAKSGSSKTDEKKDGAKRSSSAAKKSDKSSPDKSAADGEDLKISADVLPDAVPIESAAKEMNGKSHAKKPASSRSRSKPSDGDGAAAEA